MYFIVSLPQQMLASKRMRNVNKTENNRTGGFSVVFNPCTCICSNGRLPQLEAGYIYTLKC